MKKNQINLLLLLIVPLWSSAQSMALETISASGGTTVSGDYSLTWTTGETVVMAGGQGEVYLGSGFQQAKKRTITVGVFSVFMPSIELKAYPNPTSDLLTVESGSAEFYLSIYDLLGRQVVPGYQLNGGIGQLDLSPLPAGTYILQALDAKGRLAASVKIQHTEN